MPNLDQERLRSIKTFPSLVKYLRDELDWPIETDDFSDITFEYDAEELGIDPRTAAKIQDIKQLRPLTTHQPWGIFFLKFEPKRLPVVALRRILSQLVVKKRSLARRADQPAWHLDDLLFISNYGEGEERQITFAHFSQNEERLDLPTLKVLGWNNLDTPLSLNDVAGSLTTKLLWPRDYSDIPAWRTRWRSAFVLQYREVITTARDLSVRLAELARAIRDRIETALSIETERGPLTQLMKSFQEALVNDLTAKGFADMYAQTIAYGLLSARIADPQRKTADDFAAHMRTNPFLRELMETFLTVGGRRGRAGGPGIDFDELGVSEVVDLLDNANMEAVVRDFGDRNPQEDPVIRFYEDFLREYDPKEKKQRGVFYTPRPVVSYIIRSVHELLRTEFGLEDGLADTTTWGELAKRHPDMKIPTGVDPGQAFVQMLDPATGTGTFLVEVIDQIHRTLAAKWKTQGHNPAQIEALWNEYVPAYLLPRLHGYELLMAPYAIAHLKIGLKLYETGYRFGSDERARIFLTNAIEPPRDFSGKFEFAIPALAHEAKAVNAIKQKQRFTVVLGNPPYAGISSNMTEDAQRMVDAYKVVDGQALNERKLWLQDDYVKFIRLGQIILEQAPIGILGYITNHGYLDNPTFRGMRQSLMETFSRIRVLDLHGNANKGEQSPDGSDDKNVFDIRQGVAICVATRSTNEPSVKHGDLWGSRERKYAWLSTHSFGMTVLTALSPDSPYYFFEPRNIDCRDEYNTGWKLNDAMPVNCAGFITARDHFVVDFDRDVLLERIEDFANPKLTDNDVRKRYFEGCGSNKYPDGDTRGWKIARVRKQVQTDRKWRERVKKCWYRPFDVRFVYWADWMVDWPRPVMMRHMLGRDNFAFHVCRQSISDGWGHVLVTRSMTDDCYVSNKTRERGYTYPLYLFQEGLALGRDRQPNFSTRFLEDMAKALGLEQRNAESLPSDLTPEDIFNYIYAVLHSPGYRSRYAEFLKIDFPRLPLPSMELLRVLACLGGELASLHLMESPKLDRFITAYFGPRDPEVERVAWSEDTIWLDAAATRKGQSGGSGTIGFRGVPEAVWNFHIGGYQVCEKWLKDRKGRKLSADDIAHYQKIVVALSETGRLMSEIDDVIEAHGGWPGAFALKT